MPTGPLAYKGMKEFAMTEMMRLFHLMPNRFMSCLREVHILPSSVHSDIATGIAIQLAQQSDYVAIFELRGTRGLAASCAV